MTTKDTPVKRFFQTRNLQFKFANLCCGGTGKWDADVSGLRRWWQMMSHYRRDHLQAVPSVSVLFGSGKHQCAVTSHAEPNYTTFSPAFNLPILLPSWREREKKRSAVMSTVHKSITTQCCSTMNKSINKNFNFFFKEVQILRWFTFKCKTGKNMC